MEHQRLLEEGAHTDKTIPRSVGIAYLCLSWKSVELCTGKDATNDNATRSGKTHPFKLCFMFEENNWLFRSTVLKSERMRGRNRRYSLADHIQRAHRFTSQCGVKLSETSPQI